MKPDSRNKTVVLLSGGLDSTVALFMEKKHDTPAARLHALAVDYGQRHARQELAAAERIAQAAGIAGFHVARVRGGVFGGALSEKGGTFDTNPHAAVVPSRNMCLLSLAAAYAGTIGANRIVIGCCAADAEVFPDCRDNFLELAERALSLGLGEPLEVIAPLLFSDKGDVVALGRENGAAGVMDISWSCYDPQPGDVPCGECNACLARAAGFRAVD